VFVSGSIGIALYPQDHTDPGTLVRQADMAMYRAKDLGRNTLHFFNDELNRSVQQRIRVDHDLHGALERGEFVLHYQPKADLDSGAVCGVEALLRWQRPGAGLVAPGDFIGVLEESRLIVPVGAWVIATACEQLLAWDRMGLPELSMAVNVSARQFRERDLALQIEAVLARTGIAPHRLELELTESLLMEDNALSREVLIGFARIGVRVAIDDFGTGHSSLSYLKRFKVDTLKIDKSFVQEVPHDPDNCAIATAVVALAHSMKLSVVCEGVETPEQVAFMRSLRCDAMQGYLLARPMPADLLSHWLRRYAAGDCELTAWRERPSA
jgi:EAL domain-containing protein (putative c-di-GMP-specific phosphodiesterase class I)